MPTCAAIIATQGCGAANFSRSVLSNADELAVLPVADSGWCDWGSPQRVFASLAGTACHARLVARIGGDVAATGAVG